MRIRRCLEQVLDIDNYDRRGERLIKKSIELFHKKGRLNRYRAIRLSHYIHRNFACVVSPRVTIGKNLYIAHAHGIHIGKTTIIGDDCKIYPGAMIVSAIKGDHGLRDQGLTWHARIGNDVTLGARCLIIGHITIGDDVTIGAGAIVTKDVPSHTVVKNVNEFRRKYDWEIPEKYRNDLRDELEKLV